MVHNSNGWILYVPGAYVRTMSFDTIAKIIRVRDLRRATSLSRARGFSAVRKKTDVKSRAAQRRALWKSLCQRFINVHI